MSPEEFTLLALFLRASFTVKIVMIILVLASIWSWGIIIGRYMAFRNARRASDIFDRAFWSGEPLDKLYDQIAEDPRNGPERIFSAGMSEWQRSHKNDGGLIAGANARIDRVMDVAINREADTLNTGLTFLASIGSVTPFIGLFGTVWGIKHSFEEIAIAQNTSLAVVAPGIAEALVATALGLLAAIPAVIFYNKLSEDADRIIGNYDTFADEFGTILSRQLGEN
ncbi:MAG: protein TolQ [Pseudomonadota bacterium]